MFWGVLLQNFTFACTMPIYMVIHLSTSTTVRPSKSSAFVTSSELIPVPIALAIGYLLPSFLSSLPAPSVLTFDGKQNFIALWQAFPVWVALVQQFLRFGLTIFGYGKKANDFQGSLAALRCVYAFLLTLATLTHLPALSMMFISLCLPENFTSEAMSTYSFANVFIPSTISASTKMGSIGHANRLLLQYDEIVGFTTVLLWASFLWTQARNRSGNLHLLTELIPRIITLTLATGPMGCAVAMLWSRDELIWHEGGSTNKKIE